MERRILKTLEAWKKKKDRMPLVIKGVRQCGKTYIIKEFGKIYFEDLAYFNFEESDALRGVFERDFDVGRIITELSIAHGSHIKPETTLIVFDEIQLCSRALTSLKYFCENAPEYPVVCAGSLLGIALQEEGSFPVGKVEFLTMYPMSFEEFLLAKGEDTLVEWLNTAKHGDPVPTVGAEKAMQMLREYYIVGGMPLAVKKWCETGDVFAVEAVQKDILNSYELDFAKHAPVKDFPRLKAIWRSVPGQLAKENKKFIFSQVKKGWRAKDLEDALEWLISAGMVHKVRKIEKPGFPLSFYADDTVFKLYLCDVGLLWNLAGLPYEAISGNSPVYTEFKGAMAENYVLLELLKAVCSDAYYWTSGNEAEIDFVIQSRELIIPAEVKSDKNIRARSLGEYRKKYNPEKSLKISSVPELNGNEIVNIPLYFTGQSARFLHK